MSDAPIIPVEFHQTFRNTVEGLLTQLAAALQLAGHNVSADDHVDVLRGVALEAAAVTGKTVPPGTAPNYADHALALFDTSIAGVLMEFAKQYLPERFKPLADHVAHVVDTTLEDGKVTVAEVIGGVISVANKAVDEFIPAVSPVLDAIGDVVGQVSDVVGKLTGDDEPQDTSEKQPAS